MFQSKNASGVIGIEVAEHPLISIEKTRLFGEAGLFGFECLAHKHIAPGVSATIAASQSDFAADSADFATIVTRGARSEGSQLHEAARENAGSARVTHLRAAHFGVSHFAATHLGVSHLPAFGGMRHFRTAHLPAGRRVSHLGAAHLWVRHFVCRHFGVAHFRVAHLPAGLGERGLDDDA